MEKHMRIIPVRPTDEDWISQFLDGRVQRNQGRTQPSRKFLYTQQVPEALLNKATFC